jgi:Rrf2 family protein
LEEIALLLKQAGLVQGKKGPGGGYRLARPPGEITAEMMLTALEGPLALVECQEKEKVCPVQDRCRSRGFWGLLQTNVRTTLQSTTLADILTL